MHVADIRHCGSPVDRAAEMTVDRLPSLNTHTHIHEAKDHSTLANNTTS